MEKFSKKNLSPLIKRVLEEDTDYYALESFLNKKQPIENCKITVPKVDPNLLPIWHEYGSITRLSAEADYVYELVPIIFRTRTEDNNWTIESILKSATKKNSALFIPLFDLSYYFSNNITLSGFLFDKPLYIPYVDGEKIEILIRKKNLQTYNDFSCVTKDWILDKEIKEQDILFIFSKKEVILNSVELEIVKNLKNITKRVKPFLKSFYKKEFETDDFLEIINKYKPSNTQPFDFLKRIKSNDSELKKFVKDVIEEKNEIERKVSYYRSRISFGNSAR